MNTTEGIHRINRVLFGPDGYLYIAIGDDGNFTGQLIANTSRTNLVFGAKNRCR